MPVSDYEISSNLACMADLHSLKYNSIFFDTEGTIIKGFARTTPNDFFSLKSSQRRITFAKLNQIATFHATIIYFETLSFQRWL